MSKRRPSSVPRSRQRRASTTTEWMFSRVPPKPVPNLVTAARSRASAVPSGDAKDHARERQLAWLKAVPLCQQASRLIIGGSSFPKTWPHRSELRTLPNMQQRCEVCENFRPEGDLKPGRVLEAVKYGARIVLLCRAHAGIAQSSGVTSFEELREL